MRLNASNMSVSDLVFGVDCHRERFDRRKVEPIQLLEVFIGVFDAPHRRLESEIQDEQ